MGEGRWRTEQLRCRLMLLSSSSCVMHVADNWRCRCPNLNYRKGETSEHGI